MSTIRPSRAAAPTLTRRRLVANVEAGTLSVSLTWPGVIRTAAIAIGIRMPRLTKVTPAAPAVKRTSGPTRTASAPEMHAARAKISRRWEVTKKVTVKKVRNLRLKLQSKFNLYRCSFEFATVI